MASLLLRHVQSTASGDAVSFTQCPPGPSAAPAWPAALLPTRTLGRAAFDDACEELIGMVRCDYAPVLLVGVRTGGLVVAETMAQATSLPVLPLTCRRPSTAIKSRVPGLKPLLATLPEPLLNALRRAEHRLAAGNRRAARPTQIDRAEAIAIGNWLRIVPDRARVLVVDDAVDSGLTLATVLRTLREVCPPDVEFRTAVITVTMKDPAVAPDYALYRGVLCRFPWSFDARG
jgi:hypoxanthine phosphoribosyltransferase